MIRKINKKSIGGKSSKIRLFIGYWLNAYDYYILQIYYMSSNPIPVTLFDIQQANYCKGYADWFMMKYK